MDIFALLADPTAWAALFTLIVLEVVLGVDNLIFIAIISNKLPVEQQAKARRIGLILALVMRLGLLTLIGWLVTLQTPLFDLGIQGGYNEYTGEPAFETAFSGRDLILLVGGLFLLWKATKEIHHSMEPEDDSGDLLDKTPGVAAAATATNTSHTSHGGTVAREAAQHRLAPRRRVESSGFALWTAPAIAVKVAIAGLLAPGGILHHNHHLLM